MTATLKMTDILDLPLDAVTQKLAFLGRTGSGKSYAATRLCEQMLSHGAHVIALDPVGTWYGLRLPSQETEEQRTSPPRRPGEGVGGEVPFDIPVFGGLHGDLPLEPSAGAMIADLITDRSLSAVLDVSQLLSSEQARFAGDFATQFFRRKKAAPSAVHLFIEESQEFAPQNIMRGEEKMLHAFERLVKLGRNFGIGVSLISQRPQEVNKKVLNQTECLFAFQMTGLQERKAVEAWVADKGLSEDLGSLLPHLEVGQPHVWSPQWLRMSETVRILPKSTYDASHTPKVGSSPAAALKLTSIDIEQLREAMAATIERAKEEDPRELRRRIAELQRSLAQKPDKPQVQIQTVEVPILPAADVERLVTIAGDVTGVANDLIGVAKDLITLGDSIRNLLAANLDRPKQLTPPASPSTRSTPPKPTRNVETGTGNISGPQQRILDAIAWWNAIGIEAPARLQVAFIAGSSPNSSSYGNNLGALRTAGYIDYPAAGAVALTSTGEQAAGVSDLPLTVEALHAAVRAKIEPRHRRLLDAVCRHYPTQVARTDLASDAEMSPTSSSFGNNLGALRSLGLITYPSQGWVRAADLLFPKGLRP